MQQTKQSTKSSGDLLYFTSDNLAFFEEQNAINHGKRLHDKAITTKTKAQVEREAAALYDDTLDEEPEYDPLDEPDAE